MLRVNSLLVIGLVLALSLPTSSAWAVMVSEPYLVTDLGLLQGQAVDVEVDIEIPEVSFDPSSPRPAGIHSVGTGLKILIRQLLPGRERGLFVQGIDVTNGKLRVEGLEPGTYELELVDSRSAKISAASRFRTLVVRPDGTTEPVKLQY